MRNFIKQYFVEGKRCFFGLSSIKSFAVGKILLSVFFSLCIFFCINLTSLLAQNLKVSLEQPTPASKVAISFEFEPEFTEVVTLNGEKEYMIKSDLLLNPVFVKYYQQLIIIENELSSFKVRKTFFEQAAGDLNQLFIVYDNELIRIGQEINDYDISVLTPLDKYTLGVFIDYIKVQSIYNNIYYTMQDKRSKRIYYREKINKKIVELEIPNLYPYHRTKYYTTHELKFEQFEKRVESLLYAIYSENLLWSIIDRLGNAKFDYHVEEYALKSLRLNPNNERALLNLALYYIKKTDENPLTENFLPLAQKNIDRVFKLADFRNNNNIYPNERALFYAYIWQSQIRINQLNYQEAGESLMLAASIFPKNGYLKLVSFLKKYKRSVFRKDKDLQSEERDSPLFVNEYNRFEFEPSPLNFYHSFNFIVEKVIFSPYLSYGFNHQTYNPFGYHFQEGVLYRFGRNTVGIGAVQKPDLQFNNLELSGLFGLTLDFSNIVFDLDIHYGLLWIQSMQDDGSFRYKPDYAVSEQVKLSFNLYQSIRNKVEMELTAKHQYSIDQGDHLIRGDLDLPMNLLYSSWGDWGHTFRFGYAISTGSSEIRYVQSVFDDQFIPTSELVNPSKDVGSSWLFRYHTTYRFYLFSASKFLTWIKGIYIAPSYHIAGIHSNLSDLGKSHWSQSVLGNIGVRFGGGRHFSLGLGWNSDSGTVINLLFF